MEYEEKTRLDTSQVLDREGQSGGGILSAIPGGVLTAGGGGLGLIGVIIAILLNVVGGGTGLASTATAGTTDLSTTCQTGADANQRQECALVADINSVQAFWDTNFAAHGQQYEIARTVLFSGATTSGCGQAETAMGPFYCPVDRYVYLDRAFFVEFRDKFGAQAGTFAQAYVIAHEYGHHVQDLEGNLGKAQQSAQGAESGSVRVELQADCYAGVWAHNAVSTGYIVALTDADIADGLDAAAKVGDDYIQKKFQGSVHPETFTHGTSAQRQKWFKSGYDAGDRSGCDTFSGSI